MILEDTLKTLLENAADSSDKTERLLLLELATTLVEKAPPPPVPKDPTEFLVLDGYDQKIAAIKALRNVSQLGLREAKEAVEAHPIVLLPVNHENANLVEQVLLNHGVRLRRLPEIACAGMSRVKMDPAHWRLRR